VLGLFAQKIPPKIAKLSDKDTNKVIALVKFSYDFRYKKPKQSLKYAKLALHIAQKQNYVLGKLKAQEQIVATFIELKKFEKAKKMAQTGLHQAKKLEDIYYVSRFYGLLSRAYKLIENKEKSFLLHKEALKYLDKQKVEYLKIYHLNSLGIYISSNYTKKRNIYYWQEAQALAKKLNLKNVDVARTYNRIGALYNSLYAHKERKPKDIQKIVAFLDTSLRI